MRTPATNFEALLGQARDCGLTQDFATAYEINVALDEADCCGGLPEQSKSVTYTDNGSYTVNPDEGYTLSSVGITVDVDQNLTVISELQLEVAQLEGEIATITSLNISENGTFTPPVGILGYNSIDVNVAGGGGVEGDFAYISTLSIYVPNNEPLPEQYYQLFNNVKGFDIGGYVNSIAFQEGNLTKIRNIDSAFYYCDSLTSITFQEGALTQVTNICDAFSRCSSLTSITFPKGALTQVIYMNHTFFYCTSISSITFSEGDLTQVNQFTCTLYSCSELTSISFPEGALTQLMSMVGTFQNCSKLTSISFPEGALTQVTSTGDVFYNCTSLKSITIPAGAFTKATYMTNQFRNCSALRDLTIYNLPNINLTDIGFKLCPQLTLSSLQNIVNALPTTTSGYKCTLGTTNLAKLSNTDIQIATDKGWTLN